MGIRCLNFQITSAIENEGTIEVYGRVTCYGEVPEKIGTIVVKGKGEISYSTDNVTVDEMEVLLGEESIFNTITIVPGPGTVLLIDRDYTLPEGCSLWLNANTTLKVAEGVTFRVRGTLEMYTTPIVEGKISYK